MKCGDWELIQLKKEKRVVENNCLVDGIAVENNCNICHSKLNWILKSWTLLKSACVLCVASKGGYHENECWANKYKGLCRAIKR